MYNNEDFKPWKFKAILSRLMAIGFQSKKCPWSVKGKINFLIIFLFQRAAGIYTVELKEVNYKNSLSTSSNLVNKIDCKE